MRTAREPVLISLVGGDGVRKSVIKNKRGLDTE